MVRMSIEKIIHFKNSVSVQLEAKDKHSYHLSHSQIVHKHKEMSQMKIEVVDIALFPDSLCVT